MTAWQFFLHALAACVGCAVLVFICANIDLARQARRRRQAQRHVRKPWSAEPLEHGASPEDPHVAVNKVTAEMSSSYPDRAGAAIEAARLNRELAREVRATVALAAQKGKKET